MRSKRVILHRAVLVVAVLAMAVAYGGCSSVEPTDAWADETGRVAGTVRSDAGTLLPEIEVWLWAELGVEGREVCYQTETDLHGAYEVDDVEMATSAHVRAELLDLREPDRRQVDSHRRGLLDVYQHGHGPEGRRVRVASGDRAR